MIKLIQVSDEEARGAEDEDGKNKVEQGDEDNYRWNKSDI